MSAREAAPRRTPVAGTAHAPLDTTPVAGPDAKLLRLCDELLDVIAEQEALHREVQALPTPWVDQPRWRPINAERHTAAARRRALLSLVAREAAVSAAGIYAKAQVVRRLDGKPSGLAASLATELLANATLRRALWPVDGAAL